MDQTCYHRNMLSTRCKQELKSLAWATSEKVEPHVRKHFQKNRQKLFGKKWKLWELKSQSASVRFRWWVVVWGKNIKSISLFRGISPVATVYFIFLRNHLFCAQKGGWEFHYSYELEWWSFWQREPFPSFSRLTPLRLT